MWILLEWLLGAAVMVAPPASQSGVAASKPAEPMGVERIQADAMALRSMFHTKLVQQFLEATSRLPHVPERSIYRESAQTDKYYSAVDARHMPIRRRRDLLVKKVDEDFFYNTHYGSPLAYARPLELVAQAGLTDVSGKRVLDYGYGTVGHLRLLANSGATAVGVDVDPMLMALYCMPEDVGLVANPQGHDGRVVLVNGSFPGDEEVKKAVGAGYDLFISKNTLKNGYIHPTQPVDPRALVKLGVSEQTFVKTIYSILKPGGLAMIYNICPAQAPAGKGYIPWADGKCPFAESLWKKTGFEVLAFDKDDTETCRKMAKMLGWDKQGMDLEKDLFAHYTLVRKPAEKK